MALLAISMKLAIADTEFVEGNILSLFQELQVPLRVVLEKKMHYHVFTSTNCQPRVFCSQSNQGLLIER